MEVYRLLRAKENPFIYLSAKAPNQASSVLYHVAYGSYNESRFISTCGSLDHAITFRRINQNNGYTNGPIVKINIVDGMTVYDLNSPSQIDKKNCRPKALSFHDKPLTNSFFSPKHVTKFL